MNSKISASRFKNGASVTQMLILSIFAFNVVIISATSSFGQPDNGIPPIDKTVVYIECKSDDGRISRGTGVVVNSAGAVLTAKHVAPIGSSCLGGIGTAAIPPMRRLERDSRQVPVDAMLMKFVRFHDESFQYLTYQRVEDSLRGKPILAYGFPGEGLGDIFQSEGTIAQTNIDSRGIVGTTAMQSSGMSGGPVVLKESGNLLGIIVGAEFDPNTGAPASFGVLAAQEIAIILELIAAPVSAPRPLPGATSAPAIVGPRVSAYVPQHEGLLRETISAVARGICPDTMSPLLKAQCQTQMPNFGNLIRQKGNILSTQFAGIQPTPMGTAEAYSIVFSEGPMVWLINTIPDGRLLVFWSPSQ